MSGEFVHLHNHTDFSMLDGAARIDRLTAKAKELGMSALGITDHGNMFGAYEFYKTANKMGVKPIIGLEAYMTPGTHRSERRRVQFGDGAGEDVSAKGAYTHLTLWAETQEGMHNLFKFSSKSWLEGYYYKPRGDLEILERYHQGLIVASGCPSGEVQTYLRLGMFDKAVESAATLQEIFGKENFFVELMDHDLAIEKNVRKDLLRLAKKLNAPLVATNDLHYVDAADAHSHDTLLCVSSGSYKAQTNRFKFDGSGYHLRPAEEMRNLFSNYPEACDNTLAIAERCNTIFEEGTGTYMPEFPVPDGHTEESWFKHETEVGLHKIYGENLSAEVRERADMEMRIIIEKGYSGYFLVVADYCNWAKRQGIRVGPGRGSGAGSIVAYAMGITNIDPLRYGLLFERFLNPERPSMPDFDVDFDERRRGEVIQYVTDKYGADHCCQIVTYGTIKAKQAVKDAGRVLEKPYALGDSITKAMPPAVMGKDVPLNDLFNEEHERYAEGQEFRDLYHDNPEVKQVVDEAMGIEGLKRQWGVHACGMIMSSVPLEDVIPIMKREQDGQVITQFDYPSAEALGLVKMDFLGLRNLTILDDALTNIQENQGVTVDLDELAHDPTDAKTYEMISNGDTLGVFQLDSDGIRSLLKLLRPETIEDISALSALYRPGPMGSDAHTNFALRKRGMQEITPIHPELEEPLHDILSVTYGLIVYQEQIQQIAQRVAGYSLGHADLLRRAMGKKKPEVLAKEYEPFSQGMKEHGYSKEACDALWDVMVPFANYAFNKSHSAAYALVTYWTAYLKANYPVEFMAALLQSVRDDKKKSAVYLNECRHLGVKVLPPDVNLSSGQFRAVGDDIRFGLGAIRNIGDNVVDGIIQARNEKGHATDFYDFLDKIPLVVCNKRAIESMIKAGAFDSLGHNRRALMNIHAQAVDQITEQKRNEANGQDSLAAFFDLPSDDSESQRPAHEQVPDIDEWDKRTKLSFEREMLGLYVSDHPLHGLEHVLDANREYPIATLLAEDGPRGQVRICGMITQVQRKQTKAGKFWAILSVEDLDASIDVMVFPRQYESVADKIATDIIVTVTGHLDDRESSLQLNARELTFPATADIDTEPVVIAIKNTRCTPRTVANLKQILQTYPGGCEVHLKLLGDSGDRTFRFDDAFRVRRSQPLLADLKALLGSNSLVPSGNRD